LKTESVEEFSRNTTCDFGSEDLGSRKAGWQLLLKMSGSGVPQGEGAALCLKIEDKLKDHLQVPAQSHSVESCARWVIDSALQACGFPDSGATLGAGELCESGRSF